MKPARRQRRLEFDDGPLGGAIVDRLDHSADVAPAETGDARIAGSTTEDKTGKAADEVPASLRLSQRRDEGLFGRSAVSIEPPAFRASADESAPGGIASGEKAKARDLLAAIRTLHTIESEHQSATPEERQMLGRFAGFGAVALSIFPDPVTGRFKDAGWQVLGEELRSLLTSEEYDSAKRTTFNAFYTSPVVIGAMHAALSRLGVPADATVLEPGCGIGNFLAHGAPGYRFVGVELDSISGRIARALHPGHDIRIENFRDSRLPENRIDAVIGNVPFADLKLEHAGQRWSLHDYFFAKSVDALKPGGVLALVTTHFTLDKQNAAIREFLAARADFLGAIRLPSDAFKREGTAVVTDIVFLRKRSPGEPAKHVDDDWLDVAPIDIEGVRVPINRYFHHHPEMVLGTWSRKNLLYGSQTGYSVSGHGDLTQQLAEAVRRLPETAAARDGPSVSGTAPAAVAPVPAPFVPPPPLRHLGEGSFFVGDDRVIRQIVGGEGVPVVYSGTKQRADGTLVGRRLAALIGLRDRARRVLQSQNEGWPDAHREAARRELNRDYDRFVAAFGPVNKTTFTPAAGGTLIRRMPNVVKFREDPDAMLVLALEEYDEETGTAAKAAILQKDVVGNSPPVTEVQSAEEGLLVALDRTGAVDLPLIAALYGKPVEDVIRELGDLIWFDPELDAWQTADVYLSGNVRAKLVEAEAAGFAENVAALRAVQPEDVLPGDIDAGLGSPWIPEADIQAFAGGLFQVESRSIRIGHLPKDAVWSLDADYAVERSVAATSEFGTSRVLGTALLELALNQKTPVVYDVVRIDGREERTVNPDETLAAREKQKLIKERFRAWVFADPDRAERLVRIYNDTYNNLRPRRFDGSHLDFPGMNRTITLRPHQTAAVWRGMSSGNTLLAHAVGAGKSFTMAATGMKLKQAGLVRKPMYVVPNHLLEQFSRDFLQLYPNARLLVATKDDMARDRRKLLTAKIAGGDWDGIVVTHSSFERIGMSREFQAGFLREQIAEYDRLLCDTAAADKSRGRRNLIKTIEKQKAKREERLRDLLAEDKKDDGLVFDELGVDHLFVDEAHAFKNLETPTKMERVAGIQTGGSERAFDLYMKCRYLNGQHAGHGVTFATGTPVSNSMVELYTMQRFLDLEGLKERGIEHFDAWAATFGEVVETMEIAPDGASLRPRSRFAKFTNLPELQQMFRAFADVRTAEMLDLPRPRLEGGKPQTVACPMSDEQHAIQQELVARYERLRSEKVDPRDDNALAITTDGRKLSLDARMLEADAAEFPGSKVNALVENVAAIWRKTAPTRGTQLVFCDLGVHPTAWGYSAYGEVIRSLVAAGVPRHEIASIGDAESDAKKQALFEKVRQGSVRVLLGSTQKMGTGTNVQKRLVALHHLDAPWKPAEVEQREGRILRQGNTNEEVSIHRYVTEGSFDAYMWQALETKAKFIAQVMTGESAVRRAEDVGTQELSYAEVKAIASGNPAVLTLAEADAELQRLAILKRNHADEQFLARRKVKSLPETIEAIERNLAALEQDIATLSTNAHAHIKIGGRSHPSEDIVDILGGRLEALPDHVSGRREFELGTWRGLRFGIVRHEQFAPDVFLAGAATRTLPLSREHHGPRAVLNALGRLARSYPGWCDQARQDKTIAEKQLRDYESRLDVPFPHLDWFNELTTLRDQLRTALSEKSHDSYGKGNAKSATRSPADNTETSDSAMPDSVTTNTASPDACTHASPPASATEIAERIKALQAARSVDTAEQRPADRDASITSSAEVPIAARVRRKAADKASKPPDDPTPIGSAPNALCNVSVPSAESTNAASHLAAEEGRNSAVAPIEGATRRVALPSATHSARIERETELTDCEPSTW